MIRSSLGLLLCAGGAWCLFSLPTALGDSGFNTGISYPPWLYGPPINSPFIYGGQFTPYLGNFGSGPVGNIFPLGPGFNLYGNNSGFVPGSFGTISLNAAINSSIGTPVVARGPANTVVVENAVNSSSGVRQFTISPLTLTRINGGNFNGFSNSVASPVVQGLPHYLNGLSVGSTVEGGRVYGVLPGTQVGPSRGFTNPNVTSVPFSQIPQSGFAFAARNGGHHGPHFNALGNHPNVLGGAAHGGHATSFASTAGQAGHMGHPAGFAGYAGVSGHHGGGAALGGHAPGQGLHNAYANTGHFGPHAPAAQAHHGAGAAAAHAHAHHAAMGLDGEGIGSVGDDVVVESNMTREELEAFLQENPPEYP